MLELKELQKAEALKRMKLLELHQNAINEFDTRNIINKSEICGFLYWLDDEEAEIVKEFEKNHDALVYHVIKNCTQFGTLLSILYVSKYVSEWERDINDIEDNVQLCYVKNLDDDMFSEFGYIAFKKSIGGLQRTD